MMVPQRVGNKSTQDPAIPLLGIYPKDTQFYYNDTCSTMFIAALFITARKWDKPECLSVEKQKATKL